ncbi:MAG: hypothetical protein ABW056_06140 [Thermoanaerobaculia bacterium]
MTETEEPPRPDEDDETLDTHATGAVDAMDAADVVGAVDVVDTVGAVDAVVAAGAASAVDSAGLAGAEAEDDDVVPPPVAEAVTGVRPAAPAKGSRPDLTDRRDPLYREVQGYKLRLDPPDLARLRELPGSRGKSDTEIGEAFFDGQGERLASSIKDDVPSPSELRVVVDPYSRQAFLALEGTIRGILSF